jgi:predicted transcriptional regulator
MARISDDWQMCVVVNDDNVVLGMLGRRTLSSGGNRRAEEAMAAGPSTIRPSARIDAIVDRMLVQNLTCIIVTHPDGILVGVLRQEDLTSS